MGLGSHTIVRSFMPIKPSHSNLSKIKSEHMSAQPHYESKLISKYTTSGTVPVTHYDIQRVGAPNVHKINQPPLYCQMKSIKDQPNQTKSELSHEMPNIESKSMSIPHVPHHIDDAEKQAIKKGPDTRSRYRKSQAPSSSVQTLGTHKTNRYEDIKNIPIITQQRKVKYMNKSDEVKRSNTDHILTAITDMIVERLHDKLDLNSILNNAQTPLESQQHNVTTPNPNLQQVNAATRKIADRVYIYTQNRMSIILVLSIHYRRAYSCRF